MNRIFARLFVGFVTFALGYAAHTAMAPSLPSATVGAPATSPRLQTLNFGFRIGDAPGPTKSATRRVSQEALIKLPPIGRVRVQAFEPLGDGPEFVFTDPSSGKERLSAYFSDYGLNEQSKTRFKIISVKQFSSPLIIAIGMNPGGSDCAWEASIIGAVDGKLEELTYEHLQTSDEGGFFVGDLGRGIGFGAAQWDFVWGEYEAHVSPHQYQITLYKWNGWRFEWYRVFRTRGKYTSGRAALRANGFRYSDIRKIFPDWSDVERW